jgi:putative transposase
LAERELRTSIVVKRIKEIKADIPRTGGKKMHFLLTDTFQKHGIKVGRDKLFDLIAEYGLQVRRRKRRRIATTDSDHPYRKYPNLVKELQVIRPEHLWVSDITYISLSEGFCYLSLVTDAYSRKIVGYCLYPTLKAEGPVNALQMALTGLADKLGGTLIHHSDRGVQYCCGDYIALLESREMLISMTEKGDPYENALAERVNGILKDEFALDKTFASYWQALQLVEIAVAAYNKIRPHASCDYLTPEVAHKQQGALPMRWKKKIKEKPAVKACVAAPAVGVSSEADGFP